MTTYTVTRRRSVGVWWLALSAAAIAVYAPLPYLTGSLEQIASDGTGLAEHYLKQPDWVRVAMYLHIVFSGVALLLSPAQLSARIRARAPGVHRVVGRITLTAMVVGGLGGLALAPYGYEGVPGALGFGLLAILSVVFPLLGLRAVRAGRIAEHRRWMIRAFALIYAGVTLRVWMIVLTAAGLEFDEGYPLMPFGCWVPNLLVAELVLRRRG
ncbi:hypothetical protein GCM10022243_35460 [Saccharothrix violaceirubra]|uniref:Putative membrane protein n=1 Tax=Saccharothrix violaceirubra TaxID=413306 RepID=A0A7W7WU72_9PSEU|nr:DUF2306 domain-containing protein [Saccharothrix violaceirubra]MBB4963919.1 putative membrane protein [Saccharothrix violaceirubra]